MAGSEKDGTKLSSFSFLLIFWGMDAREGFKVLARVLQRMHVAIKHSPFAILLDPLPILPSNRVFLRT